jgi:succinylglutamic semialdehyde dehydrogenase
VDPGDREVIIGDFPVFGPAPAEAIQAARAAQPAWAALPPEDRANVLRKLRAELRNRSDELVTLLSAETGRALWETREEVQAMHVELDGLLESSLTELALCRPSPVESHVEFRPLGVVAILSPYPQPALLMHLDVLGALVAGCTVVCKPSELTPATAQLYAEIFHEADLPRGIFNLVQGDAKVGEELAQNSDVDGVLFAGSIAGGRRLLEAQCGAERPVRTLVSGHAVVLVMDDAHIDEAAYQIVTGACTTAGQRCTSTHRVFVHRRVADQLLGQVVNLLEQMKVGYSTDPGTFMGPLISSQAVDRYLRQMKHVGGLGGEELVHGAPLSSRRRGFYVAPSLHQLPLEAMPQILDEEQAQQVAEGVGGGVGPKGGVPARGRQIFRTELSGPLVVAGVVDTLEQGLDLLKGGPACMVMSVFCRSTRTMERVRQTQPAGLCLQNLPTTHFPVRLPHHPLGLGNALPAGTLTARTCTRLSVVVMREAALDVTMLPPGLPRE